jgi:sulfate adenylyltransferase subunit 2
VHRNEEALASGMGPTVGSKLACCTALKTEALKQAVTRFGLDALILGIRGDEHAVRGKERIFSPRREDFTWRYQDQPAELWDLYEAAPADDWQHVRVHPLLRWRELDVWSYVQREGIPLVGLYLAKDGKRYRSIGCATCCAPVASEARSVDEVLIELRRTREPERAGRAQDKEDSATMQKLRALGYM